MKTTPLIGITISYVSGKIEVTAFATTTDFLLLYLKFRTLTDDDNKVNVILAPPSFWISYPVSWDESRKKVAQESIDQGNLLLRKCLDIVIGEGIERNKIAISGNISRV